MNDIKLEITITKEAVESFFYLLGTFIERESTKERDNISNTNIAANTNLTTTTEDSNTHLDTNKNINNNIIVSSVSSVSSERNNQGNSESYDQGNSDEPTLENITAYISKCGYKFSPNKFYNHYTNNNWRTNNGNGVDMKERWREFCDMWSRTERKPLQQPTAKTTGMGTQEERRAMHPFQKTEFVVTDDGEIRLA